MRESISRGALARTLYVLGLHRASGTLTLNAPTRRELFVVSRGRVVRAAPVPSIAQRLARIADQEVLLELDARTVAASGPDAGSELALADWARDHLEAQLHGAHAELLQRELAGARLALRPALAPAPRDEPDRRMLAALAQPRRLEQIWADARTPRFRLLAFVHFLRAIDALDIQHVAAPADAQRRAALALLGIDDARPELVKRAYRRLARSMHPDLEPHADADRRRQLERRFIELTTAYEVALGRIS